MSNVFDIYTIIFLALAVFIFLRLRSVLGQRTGRERPPYDPVFGARRGAQPGDRQGRNAAAAGGGNRAPRPAEAGSAAGERWKGIAESGSAVAAGLDAIAAADTRFRREAFHRRRARRL